MIKFNLYLFLTIFCINILACKKSSINTTVRGTVVDTVKNKAITNQKVIVVACYPGNFRPICGNMIFSTLTNKRGEFEINFDAPKNPLGFEVRAILDSNFYFSASPSEVVTPLVINNYTLYAREISFLKVLLKVNNNPFNQLGISCGNSNHFLIGGSIDTLLYFKILPKAENKLIFTVWDPAVGKYRGLIDTLHIGLLDTTLYSRQILNTQNMPIH